MRSLLKVAALAFVVAVAAPASAQVVFVQPVQAQPQAQPQPVHGFDNVLRVNVGYGGYNSSYYNCVYWAGWVTCGAGAWAWFNSFLVGPQVDLNLGGINNISVGFNVLIGTLTGNIVPVGVPGAPSANATIWEPMVDYVAKFGPNTQDTIGRLRVGGSALIGPNGGAGGTFRFGGGVSFLNASRLGVGLDLVLAGGGYHGYWIGGIQIMASPEFHF